MVQEETYPRGAVRRIKLTDFMSYAGSMDFEVGSRVNLVEGPNGVGKSSLVTAICVGLAGPMKVLGRQSHLEELINRDCPGFEVETTLSGGPGQPDIVVHRRTERGGGGSRGRKRRRTGTQGQAAGGAAAGDSDDDDDGDGGGGGAAAGGRSSTHTEWRIDGRVVTEARVKDLVKDMGVHFDNLCQFLPQERVIEFTNLSPTELLESTEEAIGKGELLTQHKQLVTRSAQLKIMREELNKTLERQGRVEAEQAASKPDYDRLQRRNTLRTQADQLEQKRFWLEKEQCAQKLQAARAGEAREQQRLDAAKQRLAQVEAPYNSRHRAVVAAQRAASAQVQAVQLKDKAVAHAVAQLGRQEAQCKDTEEKLAGLDDKARRWETQVTRCRQDLQRLQQEHENLPRGLTQEQMARLGQIAVELAGASEQAGAVEWDLKHKEDGVKQLAARIRQLEDAARQRTDRREQRLHKLEVKFPGSRQLHNWLRETKEAGGFRARVYGPVLMELSAIQDPDWASYLESVVGPGNLAAVVVEDMSDNNKVHQWLNARPNNKTRILCYRNSGRPLTYPHGPASQYGAYGITHTLDQVFEATSDLIKMALTDVCGLNMTFIGSAQTNRAEIMRALMSQTQVRRVFMLGKGVFASNSIYNPNHVTQKIADVNPAHLLADDVVAGNEQEEQQQLEELRREHAGAAAEAGQLRTKLQGLNTTMSNLAGERRGLNDAKARIEQRLADSTRKQTDLQRQLERLYNQGNPTAEAQGLRRTLAQDAEELMRKARTLVGLMAEQQHLNRQLAAAELTAAAAAAGLEPLQAAVRRAQDGVRAAEGAVAAARQVAVRAQGKLAEKEELVKEALGGRTGPTAALRAVWAGWPEEVEEVEELLAQKREEMQQAQAAMRGDDVAVLEAWQRRDKEIGELRQRAAASQTQVDAATKDLEDRKSAWLPALKGHIERVNESLKRHFARIACAGEVALKEAGEEFSEYAAEIRVKYRSTEPLRPLNRNHHSGGERSVATMLYLMALQGVTTTPFRIVDEINQGMDPINERKVFNLLVRCSARPDTPQCFLLTPKMVAKLHYNRHVDVLHLRPTNPNNCSSMIVAPSAARRAAAAAAAVDNDEDGGQEEGYEAARGARARRQQRQRADGVGDAAGWIDSWYDVDNKDNLFFGE